MDDDSQRSGFLARLIGIRRRRISTEEEFQNLINESEEVGIINEQEEEMFHSIFEFGDTIVRQIMVPRTDMVCFSADAPLNELVKRVMTSGHSRIPVYEETIDKIVGVLYVKDLLQYWGEDPAAVVVREVMRQPYFVPETKNVAELLREFQTKHVHMAIAVDEYGGTSGLITFEDLIEEIVGDIQDEFDLEEEWLVEVEPGVIVVDARLNIDELEEYFDVEVTRDKFDTVGGYLFNLFGRVPSAGEKVTDLGLVMTVMESDDRKIEKVQVARIENVTHE